MSELTASIHERLDPVEPAVWQAMFAGHPDSLELLRLTADCGMDGFAFGAILVSRGVTPLLLLPLFVTRLRLAGLLEGKAAKSTGALERFLPGLLLPRLLGVGFVEGEWGQAGIAPGTCAAERAQAWELAYRTLHLQAKQRRAGLMVFLNFTPDAAGGLPGALSRIDTPPCARLAIGFATVDEYLQRLSKSTRKNLRRKLKDAAEIHITRPDDIAPWLDEIHRLYLQTVKRAELSLGVQRKSYFARIAAEVPGAHYVLYFHQGLLLAFNLLIEREGTLIDKYFCMDEQAGREFSLYFVSWMENVRHCCQKGLSMYHAGPGAEATKARLGVEFVPSVTLFRHRNPLVHWLLSRLSPLMAYRPEAGAE